MQYTFDTGYALGAGVNRLILSGVGPVSENVGGGFLFSMPTAPISGLLSVNLLDELASEFPHNPASFEISRALDESFDSLDIVLEVSGTATLNDDFVFNPNPLRMNNFQQSLLVSIVPLRDSESEGIETALINIAPGGGFKPVNLEPFTITITDHPVDQWNWDNFYSLGLPELSGDNEDPDGDGIPNLLEYAMAEDPIEVVKDPPIELFQLEDAGNIHFGIRYFENANLQDVEIVLEVSTDLSTWMENTEGLEDQFIEISRLFLEDRFQVESVVATPINSEAGQFVRLKALRLSE